MADPDDSRRALRRALAPQLGHCGAPLECVAEEVLGEEDGVIDWVAAGPEGRPFVLLVSDAAGDASLLQQGLVQRAWVRARIADWRKLAPSLALRADLEPRLLLIARDFARATRIAAREAGAGEIWLARWSAEPGTGRIGIGRIDAEPAVARAVEPLRTPRAASRFRTALRDADFSNASAT